MRKWPATDRVTAGKPLIAACRAALALLTSCVLAGCSGGVQDSVTTAVEDSSSAIATARLALTQITDGKLTQAATATTLDDALKELQTSRDTVAKLSPATPEGRDAVAEALDVLDGCAAGLTTARNAVASADGTPAIADGSQALATAADRLAELSAKDGGK
ncbi:hypothetical protein GCM10009712_10290 [Pseudarthrobacter sulfonivorans]|uniref:hypothetical protein n=1 Tax=Pseudarthrobacter sulfonivorans TaxID=121292 RepID=UPI00168AFA78|nr:hypothetical protein [Pseudarthrobacter sulfonivorans]